MAHTPVRFTEVKAVRAIGVVPEQWKDPPVVRQLASIAKLSVRGQEWLMAPGLGRLQNLPGILKMMPAGAFERMVDENEPGHDYCTTNAAIRINACR